MIRKIATLLGCLLSVAIFGPIGAGASWVVATSVRDAMAARDCVKVKADVISTLMANADVKPSVKGRDAPGIYRYTIEGQEYTGSRLGTSTITGADPFGDWYEAMQEFLQGAAAEKRPITVCVDPDDPTIAVVDRDIRWGLVSFFFPFALVFSLIALASLYGLFRALIAPAAYFARPKTETHPAGMWIFAIIWNVLSFPIAGSTIPEFVRDGDWEAWLILFFPLMGLLIAWGGFRYAIGYHSKRYGGRNQ